MAHRLLLPPAGRIIRRSRPGTVTPPPAHLPLPGLAVFDSEPRDKPQRRSSSRHHQPRLRRHRLFGTLRFPSSPYPLPWGRLDPFRAYHASSTPVTINIMAPVKVVLLDIGTVYPTLVPNRQPPTSHHQLSVSLLV